MLSVFSGYFLKYHKEIDFGWLSGWPVFISNAIAAYLENIGHTMEDSYVCMTVYRCIHNQSRWACKHRLK